MIVWEIDIKHSLFKNIVNVIVINLMKYILYEYTFLLYCLLDRQTAIVTKYLDLKKYYYPWL